MKKKFLITTPIYYPNADLHIGHAYTTVIADIIARFKRYQNYDVLFLTGSDEHGHKIYQTVQQQIKLAQPQEKDMMQFLDFQVEQNIKKVWKALDIQYDSFIRTTNPQHIRFTQETFQKLYSEDLIKPATYHGYYCVHCEIMMTLENAKKNNLLCDQCQRSLSPINEENFFLKISSEMLKNIFFLLENNKIVIPETRLLELQTNFPSVNDMSISRENVSWGISVPANVLPSSHQTIYVWFDALMNYLSGLPNSTWWTPETEKVQIIGKEIMRFHCIYWPVILTYLKLPLPNKILTHGWITSKNLKMSKSTNNGVNPIELVKTYGIDPIRFFLAKNAILGNDIEYSIDLLITTINTDLANGIGNFFTRCLGLLQKLTQNIIPRSETRAVYLKANSFDNLNSALYHSFVSEMNEFNLPAAIKLVTNYINGWNLEIEQQKPWAWASNQLKPEQKGFLLYFVKAVEMVYTLLAPILINGYQLFVKTFHANICQELTIDLISNFTYSQTPIELIQIPYLRIKTHEK